VRRFAVSIFILTALFNWILVSPTFAAATPTITEPSSGAVVSDTSPKLSWTNSEPCTANGSCYLVEVDNSESFDSLEKSTYTNSTSYSPQGLTEGNWYWRVKAKDNTGAWSEFAQSAFTISLSSQVPPSINQSPHPESSSTPLSQGGPSNFSYSNSPSSIQANQSFTVTVNLALPSNPNSTFYIKSAFKKSESSNYFGQTKVGGGWVKNGASYSEQLKIQTDGNGIWNGAIEVMADNEDSGYTGTGSYIFKIGRYTQSGSGPTWSNESPITITGSPASSSTPRSSASPTLKSSPLPSSVSKINPSPVYTGSKSNLNSLNSNFNPQIATITAEASETGLVAGESSLSTTSRINWLYLMAGILLLGASVVTLIVKYKIRLRFGE
jgi:hypothetical protein